MNQIKLYFLKKKYNLILIIQVQNKYLQCPKQELIKSKYEEPKVELFRMKHQVEPADTQVAF